MEDTSISESYRSWGPAWALISRQLPGRSPVDCRRRWLRQFILPILQIPAKPDPPMGAESAKRRSAIEGTIIKARLAGLRESPAFPPLTVMKPLTKSQQAEWDARLQGFDKVGTKWVLFPEEKRISLPYQKLASILPRHLPRWKIRSKGWSSIEDAVLREAYETHGPNWIAIHYALPKRTWQECRKRLTMLSLNWNPTSTVVLPGTPSPTIETKDAE